ncbi:response regulator [Desulfobacterium sp. N47]|uniref:Response regulatory domain-containing protein n=1 Tax=uncultured Desulfobacterium sp. TaxID=201089 RepID=E1Y8C2_9BACT|nr:hypothetical protein N47_A08450 [uncultured Desulfobacterium sp.]
MSDKILFVDDDLNVLDAYKRQLKRQFNIDTAREAEEGLNAVRNHGPYAVIVSDLRMPGMDGNHFLSRVKEIAPESVRMMLTGFADIKTAMDAINRGNIFRLLTKPCSKEVLADALTVGIEQYKKKSHIKEKILSDMSVRPGKKILIVDDDRVILRIITNALKDHKELKIITALNGKEAIKILSIQDIDMVVTDLYMPGINGLQLLSYMKKNYPGIPAIVLTGYGSKETEERIKALGDFQYFEKPLDMNVLIEVLLNTLYSAHAGQIHGVSIASFLQMIDMDGKVCTLKIRSGKRFGCLYFFKGKLIDAETGQLRGEEAAIDIIGWDNSVIEIENVCKKNKNQINKSIMQILIESTRIKDEIRSGMRN